MMMGEEPLEGGRLDADARARRWGVALLLLVIGASLAVKAALWGLNLPEFGVDENDVVEGALSYLAGDFENYFRKYGQLTMNLLAAVLQGWRWLSEGLLGWDPRLFFLNAFFDPGLYYLIARALHSAALFGIAWLAWSFARRHFGHSAAWAALALGLAPLLDLVTGFTIRIDTFVGLFALLALLAAANLTRASGHWAYFACGAAAGLAIAAKPLPGSLLLPALLYACHAVDRERHPEAVGFRQRFVDFLFRKAFGVLVLGLFVGHAVGNPTFLLKPLHVIYAQIETVLTPSTRSGIQAGWDYTWFSPLFGWPLTVLAGTALLRGLFWNDRPGRIVLLFIVTYMGLFSLFTIHPYWFNPVFPALFLLVGRLLGEVVDRVLGAEGWRRWRPVAALAAGVLVAAPAWFDAVRTGYTAWRGGAGIDRPASAARTWIETHLPGDAKVLTVGYYAYGPRLVANTAENQFWWSESFMYGRRENIPWVRAFLAAYDDFPLHFDHPRYEIGNLRVRPVGSGNSGFVGRLLVDELDRFARREQARYLVVQFRGGFHAPWEERPGVTRLAAFPDGSGERVLGVFEIAPSGVETPPEAADLPFWQRVDAYFARQNRKNAARYDLARCQLRWRDAAPLWE